MNEKEAAAHIGMSAMFLRTRRCYGGDAPAYVRIGRTIRYRRADLDAWLEAHRVEVDRETA